MSIEQTRELATGEVFTADEAKRNGLIDDLGDLDTAIDLAQGLAEMPERKVSYVKPHRGLRDRLLNNAAMATVDAFAFAIETRVREAQIR